MEDEPKSGRYGTQPDEMRMRMRMQLGQHVSGVQFEEEGQSDAPLADHMRGMTPMLEEINRRADAWQDDAFSGNRWHPSRPAFSGPPSSYAWPGNAERHIIVWIMILQCLTCLALVWSALPRERQELRSPWKPPAPAPASMDEIALLAGLHVRATGKSPIAPPEDLVAIMNTGSHTGIPDLPPHPEVLPGMGGGD